MVSFLLWTFIISESSVFAVAMYLDRICFCSVLINTAGNFRHSLSAFLSEFGWGSEWVLEFQGTLEAPPVEQCSQQLTLDLSDLH